MLVYGVQQGVHYNLFVIVIKSLNHLLNEQMILLYFSADYINSRIEVIKAAIKKRLPRRKVQEEKMNK
jgi:hypothetical protein